MTNIHCLNVNGDIGYNLLSILFSCFKIKTTYILFLPFVMPLLTVPNILAKFDSLISELGGDLSKSGMNLHEGKNDGKLSFDDKLGGVGVANNSFKPEGRVR